MTLLVVGLTGALGACTRYAIDRAATRVSPDFPLGTLLINVSGAFVLGLIAGSTLGSFSRNAVAVGFLGAYTTFSTYAFEVFDLSRRDSKSGVAYAVGTVALVTAAAWLGLVITS
jgi:CrcB protein